MNVFLNNISKRYTYSWIIKDFTYKFEPATVTGINGRNGSGKSTLIKMISSYLPPSTGDIVYTSNTQPISPDKVFTYLSLVAPYTDLIAEYTLKEIFQFHQKFKQWRLDLDYKSFIDIIELSGQKGKEIQYYSSGMNQRVQLALGILSDTSLLLLDEPTAYLDTDAKKWFTSLLSRHTSNRTVVVSSNDEYDFELCSQVIKL